MMVMQLCRLWATWLITGWPCMKTWTLTLWGKLCGTTSTASTAYGWCSTLTPPKPNAHHIPTVLSFFCICRYDDYDYGSVNVLLERSLKVFVKTMACHPEQTTASTYHAFWRHFRHSEKVWTGSDTHLTWPLSSQITWHFNSSLVSSQQRMNHWHFRLLPSFPSLLNVIRKRSFTDRGWKYFTLLPRGRWHGILFFPFFPAGSRQPNSDGSSATGCSSLYSEVDNCLH